MRKEKKKKKYKSYIFHEQSVGGENVLGMVVHGMVLCPISKGLRRIQSPNLEHGPPWVKRNEVSIYLFEITGLAAHTSFPYYD